MQFEIGKENLNWKACLKRLYILETKKILNFVMGLLHHTTLVLCKETELSLFLFAAEDFYESLFVMTTDNVYFLLVSRQSKDF